MATLPRCPICGMRFEKEMSLEYHLVRIHQKNKALCKGRGSFFCDECFVVVDYISRDQHYKAFHNKGENTDDESDDDPFFYFRKQESRRASFYDDSLTAGAKRKASVASLDSLAVGIKRKTAVEGSIHEQRSIHIAQRFDNLCCELVISGRKADRILDFISEHGSDVLLLDKDFERSGRRAPRTMS